MKNHWDILKNWTPNLLRQNKCLTHHFLTQSLCNLFIYSGLKLWNIKNRAAKPHLLQIKIKFNNFCWLWVVSTIFATHNNHSNLRSTDWTKDLSWTSRKLKHAKEQEIKEVNISPKSTFEFQGQIVFPGVTRIY